MAIGLDRGKAMVSDRPASFPSPGNPSFAVARLSLEDFAKVWTEHRDHWHQRGPFVTPAWISSWWQGFGKDHSLELLLFSIAGERLGLAPLIRKGARVRVIGSADLCDHVDLLPIPGREKAFATALLLYFRSTGVEEFHLHSCRPQAFTLEWLLPAGSQDGWKCATSSVGTALQMRLPGDWRTYLDSLKGKYRHEIRRKRRRLQKAGEVSLRQLVQEDTLGEEMDVFCHLFRVSREDKAGFLDASREQFFRQTAQKLAAAGMLNLLELSINGESVAMTYCIDLGNCRYLYNNGFNPAYRHLSIGLLTKASTIEEGIAAGISCYDFLNGGERYKYELGGQEIPLVSVTITSAENHHA
jgi:CelD/BcsL family acetyltransferase involved in cellulose biosynthesis